jgi:hypothetical protein
MKSQAPKLDLVQNFKWAMIWVKNHARNDAEKEMLVQILWNGPVKMVTSLLRKKSTWKEGRKPTVFFKKKHEIPNCG